MFDFTFQDITGFLIAFIPGLIDLGLVIYILFFLPRNRITLIFTLLVLSAACWQMDDAAARIVSSARAADIWDCLFSPAWISVGALCLHFSLMYSRMIRTGRFPALFLLYLPAAAFTGLYGAHVYAHVLQHEPFWGWTNYHNNAPSDMLMIYWISALVLASTVILFYRTWKVRKDRQLKYQSLLIATGIGICTVTGVVTQLVFPVLLHRPAVQITSSFITVFSVTTVLALTKYRLFSVSELVGNETLTEALPVMVFSVSPQKRITYVNTFGAALLGIEKVDASAMRFESLFRHESAAQEEIFNEVWSRALRGEEGEILESAVNIPRGRMDVILSVKPIVNNKLVCGVLFIARDITELKKSYQLFRHNEALLKEAQRLSHIGSWSWEAASDTLLWSDELYRIYGYRPGEYPVSYETFVKDLSPEDKKRAAAVVREALRERRSFAFYYRLSRKDGTVAMLYARGSVVSDENGHIDFINGTVQDVTDIQTKERKLKEQNAELRRINAELDRFVYSVSHDLRSPLTSVLGLTEIAEGETQDTSMIEYLSLIRKSVRKLDTFILNILDYSRNARTGIKAEEIDFSALLEEIMPDVRFLNAEQHRVKISVNVSGDAAFRSDKNRISVILNNLISNAIRYSNPEEAHPYVSISVSVSDLGAGITVSDNGIGIKSDLRDKIFEMFFRASNRSAGSGLGLYIVKEAVQMLGGAITVESAMGKGSAFHIYLPQIR